MTAPDWLDARTLRWVAKKLSDHSDAAKLLAEYHDGDLSKQLVIWQTVQEIRRDELLVLATRIERGKGKR